MRWYLIFTLRTVLFVVGVYLFSHIFFYETQEKKFQRWLENLWLKIDYLQEQAISRHLAFMRVTAGALTSIGDKLFGPQLFSIQSLGVSICLSFVFMNVYHLISEWRYSNSPDIFATDGLANLIFYSFWGLVPFFLNKEWKLSCSAYSFLPEFKSAQCIYMTKTIGGKERWFNNLFFGLKELGVICVCAPIWINLWFAFIIYWIYQDYICPCTLTIPELGPEMNAVMFGIMTMATAIAAVSTTLSVIFIFVTRLSLKRISVTNSAVKAIFLLLIGCIPVIVFYGFFKLSLLSLDIFSSPVSGSANSTAAFDRNTWIIVAMFLSLLVAVFVNIAFVFATVIFLLFAVILLIHRFLWPSIARPVYRLQQIGTGKRSALFASLGLMLMLIGIGKIEWLDNILKYIVHLFTA